LSEYRIKEDQHRFTRLLNEKLLSPEDKAIFRTTMTSEGVRDWIISAVGGNSDCALKILSHSFGKHRADCGACPYCRLNPTASVQVEALRCMETARRNEQSTERMLGQLALYCFVCGKSDCRGLPLLKGKGSKLLPENQACCFSWKNCYQCGVSQHDRSVCFDKSYLNNIACCECWTYKHVPGWKPHETTNCYVKGRLRRILSHHFMSAKVSCSFKDYIEGIYTSPETFCQFMSSIETKYVLE
jgi:hypothetical protein